MNYTHHLFIPTSPHTAVTPFGPHPPPLLPTPPHLPPLTRHRLERRVWKSSGGHHWWCYHGNQQAKKETKTQEEKNPLSTDFGVVHFTRPFKNYIWMNVTQKVMSHIIIKSNFESIWYTETLCARTHTPPKPTTLIIRNAKKPTLAFQVVITIGAKNSTAEVKTLINASMWRDMSLLCALNLRASHG